MMGKELLLNAEIDDQQMENVAGGLNIGGMNVPLNGLVQGSYDLQYGALHNNSINERNFAADDLNSKLQYKYSQR